MLAVVCTDEYRCFAAIAVPLPYGSSAPRVSVFITVYVLGRGVGVGFTVKSDSRGVCPYALDRAGRLLGDLGGYDRINKVFVLAVVKAGEHRSCRRAAVPLPYGSSIPFVTCRGNYVSVFGLVAPCALVDRAAVLSTLGSDSFKLDAEIMPERNRVHRVLFAAYRAGTLFCAALGAVRLGDGFPFAPVVGLSLRVIGVVAVSAHRAGVRDVALPGAGSLCLSINVAVR